MTVLNVSYAAIKDANKFQEYVKAAGVLLEAVGVEVVLRGRHAATICGEGNPHHVVAVFRYPDMETATGLLASEEYKQLIPLRDAACDMTIQLYEE